MPNKPKPIDKTKTLEYARKHGGVDRFAQEHEEVPKGDLDKLDAFIQQSTGVVRPTRGSAKAAPKASGPASSDD